LFNFSASAYFKQFFLSNCIFGNFEIKKMDPKKVIEKAKHYKIRLPEESYMIWVPRMAQSFILPPGWKEIIVSDGVKYIYNNDKNTILSEHPCDKYILKLIQYLRVRKTLEPKQFSPIKQMIFFDELLRPFQCELRGDNFHEITLNNTKDEQIKIFSESEQYSETAIKILLNQSHKFSPNKNRYNVKDTQIFTVAQQAEINMDRELCFLTKIAEFVAEKENLHEWIYCESIEGILCMF